MFDDLKMCKPSLHMNPNSVRTAQGVVPHPASNNSFLTSGYHRSRKHEHFIHRIFQARNQLNSVAQLTLFTMILLLSFPFNVESSNDLLIIFHRLLIDEDFMNMFHLYNRLVISIEWLMIQ